MKKYILQFLMFFVIVLVLSCGKEKKENSDQTKSVDLSHQWTEKEMLEFERNCIGFLESEGVEKAKMYCDCLLQTSVEAYPDPAVAFELEQNDIVSLFEKSECLDDLLMIKIEDPWTEEVDSLFTENCVIAQKGKGVPQEKADAYCACALEEIKKIVPNPHHVMALTEEELDHILEKCNE